MPLRRIACLTAATALVVSLVAPASAGVGSPGAEPRDPRGVFGAAAPGDAAVGTPQPVGSTRLASLRGSGKLATEPSSAGALSADGRWLVFTSSDDHVLPGRTISGAQVYLRDLSTGATRLVSGRTDGTPGNADSSDPDISADGTRVVFTSAASDLVAADTNERRDVFGFDAATGAVRLISSTAAGQPGNDESMSPAISADGLHIVFESRATNLVPVGSAFPNAVKIFGYDLPTQRMWWVSRSRDGGHANGSDCLNPAISADGSRIVFESFADNLAPGQDPYGEDVFLRDRRTDTTSLLTMGGHNHDPDISADGQHVAFDARLVDYTDEPTAPGDIYNVYTFDLAAGAYDLITTTADAGAAYGSSYYPRLSADGDVVTFDSFAWDLVEGDTNDVTDVFAYTHTTGVLSLVSRAVGGTSADEASYGSVVSDDGAFLAYTSVAGNLVRRDRNDVSDAFVTRVS